MYEKHDARRDQDSKSPGHTEWLKNILMARENAI